MKHSQRPSCNTRDIGRIESSFISQITASVVRGIFRGSSARQAEKIQEYLIVNMLFDSWCRTIQNKALAEMRGPCCFWVSTPEKPVGGSLLAMRPSTHRQLNHLIARPLSDKPDLVHVYRQPRQTPRPPDQSPDKPTDNRCSAA